MKKEIITFIVPAYNAENTLPRAIESILMQTSSRYKIIIINDGSTDLTGEIGRSYMQKYPDKIKYVYQENRGLGSARNHGMHLTDTLYLAFLDSDDWIKADYVKNITKQLEKNNGQQPEIIMTLPEIYNENSKKIAQWYDWQLFYELFPKDGVCINPQNNKKVCRMDVNQCRKVLQTEFVRKIQFRFRENVKWEDIEPHFYLLTHCSRCMGIGSIGFYYRKGSPNQITASRGSDRMDLVTIYQDLLPYLQLLDKELIYSVIRVMVSFGDEGVKMTDTDTRKTFVRALYCFFQSIPKEYDKILYQEGRKHCGKSEMRQYRIFLNVIRRKWLLIVFYDYLYRDASEQILKKTLRKLKRK